MVFLCYKAVSNINKITVKLALINSNIIYVGTEKRICVYYCIQNDGVSEFSYFYVN